jgi:hypothetical protein
MSKITEAIDLANDSVETFSAVVQAAYDRLFVQGFTDAELDDWEVILGIPSDADPLVRRAAVTSHLETLFSQSQDKIEYSITNGKMDIVIYPDGMNETVLRNIAVRVVPAVVINSITVGTP